MGIKSGYFEKHEAGCPAPSGGACSCPPDAITRFPIGIKPELPKSSVEGSEDHENESV